MFLLLMIGAYFLTRNQMDLQNESSEGEGRPMGGAKVKSSAVLIVGAALLVNLAATAAVAG